MKDNHWPNIPVSLSNSLKSTFRDSTQAWIEQSKAKIESLANKWDIELLEVLEGGALSICVLSKCESDKVVLKYPTTKQSGVLEYNTLNLWTEGTPKTLRFDEDTGAFLMSFIKNNNKKYDYKDLITLCGKINIKLNGKNQIINSIVQNINLRISWAEERFQNEKYLKEKKYLDIAKKEIMSFIKDDSIYLNHGDLQDKNLINTDEGLKTLDPMPGIGPKYFDLAFWLALSNEGEAMINIVKKITSELEDLDYDYFLKFVWCLAVIENRPYIAKGTQRRTEFIDEFSEYIQNKAK